MEIFLRQHEDGSYFIEVQHDDLKRDVNVTPIIQSIVVDKIKSMKKKLRVEERYVDWMVDTAQETHRSLSTVATRYVGVLDRLKETNEAIKELVNAWRKGQSVGSYLHRLEQILKQNQHFVENDSTIQKIPKK